MRGSLPGCSPLRRLSHPYLSEKGLRSCRHSQGRKSWKLSDTVIQNFVLGEGTFSVKIESVMKPEKSSLNFNPFSDLKSKLKKGRLFPSPLSPPRDKPLDDDRVSGCRDEELFLELMADVTPLSQDKHAKKSPKHSIQEKPEDQDEAEALLRLTNLVRYGEGFVVEDTPEYVEGTWHTVHPEVAKRLHRGEFSIQSHIDLHGCSADVAKHVIDEFLRESIRTDRRAVLVVHGRGLSSPVKPVLKTKVIEWLTSSPWNKWVIAFSSARSCDGGTGATYVLLRKKPLTKRFKKVKKVIAW
jgi:DNA-nicking Smr family endonuclease